MKTNTSMTLYHKVLDPSTRLDKWERHIIKNVMFQGGKGASINKGYDKANDVNAFIPLVSNDMTGISINIGDIIVKGSTSQEITKQSDITADSYNVTGITYADYGSSAMNHIHIGAK